ncbi:Protein FANTASTIC FOUR 3 [Striga hermonthica]|uniref:Protein FANTASTIC FOUR 3 n=1 Tax=Striga hermonthica TaxID=68872 RepID=A0A9N7NLD2_STRHE|nr:Protein FANTASTIC FOUR 3 [Striga hermonthica]
MSITSSSVCQSLKSCLDPLLFEPHDSPNQLIPPKHALQNPEKTEEVYVHPLVKRSFFPLSTKSLDMCTESLGNETGTNIILDFDEFSLHALDRPAKIRESPKKTKKVNDFPPPLTSISGDEWVQVHAHREGGRLVIRAFNCSCRRNFFRAERENGRLRLSLVRLRETDEPVLGNDDDDEGQEEVEEENARGDEKDYCEGESWDGSEFTGHNWGENGPRDQDGGKIGCKITGGDWSGSRCNGERSDRAKRLPSLPYCVAIS